MLMSSLEKIEEQMLCGYIIQLTKVDIQLLQKGGNWEVCVVQHNNSQQLHHSSFGELLDNSLKVSTY